MPFRLSGLRKLTHHPFGPEAMAAGRRLAPLVDREMTESPFASAARNSPDAFRR
jgi:hypothetical protein